MIGIGLGYSMVSHHFLKPALDQVLQIAGIVADPINLLSGSSELELLTHNILGYFGLHFLSKPIILFTAVSLSCVMVPIIEEIIFRDIVPELCKPSLESFFQSLGCTEATTDNAVRISLAFLGSVIFGSMLLTNALVLWCDPMLLLSDALVCTILGFILGLIKEFSKDLYLSTGLRIGYETLTLALINPGLL